MRALPVESAPRSRRGWSVLEILAAVLVTLALVGVITALAGRPARAGSSMEPTIPQNSRLGLSAATALVRGDIVVIRPDSRWHAVVVDEPGPLTRALRWLRVARPPRDSRMLVRIVGVPGDEVRCCGSDGKALVNGHSVPMMVPDSQFRVVVPEGRYFVAGDAPSTAHSACYLSALGVEALVPTSRIEAQVARVGWPWSSIDISASAAPYVGIPGRPASPQPIIEAGKDPSC